jgi:hypothetical protein
MSSYETLPCFLVRPHISVWPARKLDRKAAEKARQEAAAGTKAGVAVYKSLVADDALEAVKAIDRKARAEHQRRTVPWYYDGPGAIASTGYAEYMAAMESLQREFHTSVDAFLADYEAARAAAPMFLGALYNAADYPSATELRGKFRFEVACEPMPMSTDFRVQGLDERHKNEIKKQMEDRFAESMASAQQAAWDRIIKRVQTMMDKLRGYKPADANAKTVGVFRDSLVDNVKELIDVLPSLNITNDPELTAIAVRLSRELCAYSADALRENADLRENVAGKAEAALQDIWAKRRAQRQAA